MVMAMEGDGDRGNKVIRIKESKKKKKTGKEDRQEELVWPWEFLTVLLQKMDSTTLIFPTMTAPPARSQEPPPPCPAPTGSSPQRGRWWTCSTWLMSLASTPLAPTCPPPHLLLLMSRDSSNTYRRLMVGSSSHRLSSYIALQSKNPTLHCNPEILHCIVIKKSYIVFSFM